MAFSVVSTARAARAVSSAPLATSIPVHERRVVHAVAADTLPVMRWVAEEETARVLYDLSPPAPVVNEAGKTTGYKFEGGSGG
jgi:hypothetical protein